jgi:hypothetical protein
MQLREILTKQVKRYGWGDEGTLYIAGSLSRAELVSGSDIDLIYFRGSEAVKNRYSTSAIATFRTAAIARSRIGRTVNVLPVDDVEYLAKKSAQICFSAGLLQGKERGLKGLFAPGFFDGEQGNWRREGITRSIMNLSIQASLDRDDVRSGFNGYRYATLASLLAQIDGDPFAIEDAIGARKVLFAYCSASERAVGHSGFDAVAQVIDAMTPEERSEGGSYLEEAVDSARTAVKRLLTDLCRPT